MKHVMRGIAAAMLLLSPVLAWAQGKHEHDHAHGMGVQAITIKGELVDSLCYVAMAAKGAGHKQCAIDCAKAGIPISMLEDGTGKLYTVLPKEDKTGYPASVIARMGETVTLTGDLYEQGGNRYVTVESVE
ncbi:MAG: hypothetical protein HY352_02200 [Candidatus Omnitrophica bacterium]|nr:hypothetical protein [Candidatus Omnitrophota bacterium]